MVINEISLHLVSVLAFGERVQISSRMIRYKAITKSRNGANATTLTAIESNDSRDAPPGLRRFRLEDLPKAGGLFGTAVVAKTKSEAIEALNQIFTAKMKQAQLERMSAQKAITLLDLEER